MFLIILFCLSSLTRISAFNYHDVAKHNLRRLVDCIAPLPGSFFDGVCLGNGGHNSVYLATAATGERVVVRTPHEWPPWPAKNRREGLIKLYRECAFVERLSQGWGGAGIKSSHLMRCLGTNTRALIDDDEKNDVKPYTVLSNAGRILPEFVFREDWSFQKVLSVLRQLLSVTGALRRASWLHGDLWESNIGLQETAGGLNVVLMDIGEPWPWMVDDLYRVAMTLCNMLHIPACEAQTVFNECWLSCHSTVGLILDWVRTQASDPLDRLVSRVVKQLVDGPPAHVVIFRKYDRPLMIQRLWHDLLSWKNSVQFLTYWHRALVFGSRDVSFESFEQIINDTDSSMVPSPPDSEPLELRDAPPVHAANTGAPLTPAGPGCSKASCMPERLQQICELARQNPGEEGCGRMSAGMRDNPAALKCVRTCQYNTHFYRRDPMNVAYIINETNISRIPLDEWMLCTDAQLSKVSCTEFAQSFIELPETPLWLFFTKTVDGDTWHEAHGQLKEGVVPPPGYGVVKTSEDCKQVCLWYNPPCSSISFDAGVCKIGLGAPPIQAVANPQIGIHYSFRSMTTADLIVDNSSTATHHIGYYFWILMGIFAVLLICALVAFLKMRSSARKVSLAESLAPQTQEPRIETELGIIG